VTCLVADRQNSLWIGTEGKGLYKLANEKLDHFDMTDGLSGNVVKEVFEDREGNLWVVTDGGLDELRDLPVTSYGVRDGLFDETAMSVATTKDGTVWVGTRHALNALKPGNLAFSYTRGGHELPTSDAGYLYRDSRNRLWVSGGQKLFLYQNGRFTPVIGETGEKIGEVISMAEDIRHNLWVSVQVVGAQARENALLLVRNLHVADKIPSPLNAGGHTLYSLAPNPQGGLWVGSWVNGLFWFHDGRFDQVKPNGYDGQVLNVSSEQDGAIWLATPQEGVIRYADGRAQTLTVNQGMPCNDAHFVTDDHAGSHWFYLECGMVRIRDSEITRWWGDPSYRVQMSIFGPIDGSRPSRYSTPALAPDGRLWSANGSRVEVIDPGHLPGNPLPPPVHIERLVVDHQDYPVVGNLKIPVLPREIQIDYAGLSYVVPERVRFRYRLIGHDQDWTEAGVRRVAFYNDLGPGHYTFQVLACNNDGVWNTRGATLSFTVPPAWYQSLWFCLLCILTGFILLYSLYLARLRQYAHAMKMRFDERLEERTRLARDLHDTLLQTIQGSKMVADHAKDSAQDLATAKVSLSNLSDWLGRATQEGRVALDSLRYSATETNDLAAALDRTIKDCAGDQVMKADISVAGKFRDMHPIVQDEVFRIADEAIRNACLHARCKQILIELRYDKNMHVRIKDDGCGIDPETLRSGKVGHYGLTGMHERAKRIGATLTILSDRYGTEITLRVPGKSIYRSSQNSRLDRFIKSVRRRKQTDRVD
jgi:signal transduction histidine kinase/ligand-binding sensor domain-containing protein